MKILRPAQPQAQPAAYIGKCQACGVIIKGSSEELAENGETHRRSRCIRCPTVGCACVISLHKPTSATARRYVAEAAQGGDES